MIKSITLISVGFLIFFQSFGQFESPYEINVKNDIPIIAAAAGFSAFGFFLRSQITELTVEELERFDVSEVNWLDRSATRRNSHRSDVASDYFFLGSAVGAMTLAVDKRVRNDALVIGIMFIETIGMVNGLTNITKFGVGRPRPLVYNPNAFLRDKLKLNARLSFFSGHTSHSAALTFFAAKVFSDYHPDSKLKPYIWAGAATIPMITGMLRYGAGKHYPTDILAGYAVGALTGFFIPHLHKKSNSKLEIVPIIDGESALINLYYTF